VIVLDVTGMKSDACCERIQQAISARDADAVVVIMRAAGRVSLDARLTSDQAVETIRAAGYGATLAFAA
jgi:copper chaperone CopZ